MLIGRHRLVPYAAAVHRVGASRVHNTTPPGVESPEATPRMNGGTGGGGTRPGPGQRLGARRSQPGGGEGGDARGPQAEEATPVEVHRSHVAELQQRR